MVILRGLYARISEAVFPREHLFMADVFISYSRKDEAFVRRLQEDLKQHNRDTWIDWQNIPPTAEWQREIFANIEAADNFLFIVSPDSCVSEMCRAEVAYAEANHKRLILIVCRCWFALENRTFAGATLLSCCAERSRLRSGVGNGGGPKIPSRSWTYPPV